MLEFMMDQHRLSLVDIASVFGSVETVELVIAKQRLINPEEAAALAERFHIHPTLFHYQPDDKKEE